MSLLPRLHHHDIMTTVELFFNMYRSLQCIIYVPFITIRIVGALKIGAHLLLVDMRLTKCEYGITLFHISYLDGINHIQSTI